MGVEQFLELAAQFGPLGLLIAYLIWDKGQMDKKWRSLEERRLDQDQSRTEADKAMAVALNALTIVIQGRANV